MRYGGREGLFGGVGQFLANAVLSSPTITSPTVSGNTKGVPFTLLQSAVPFIYISSGSIAANGALSGFTALPETYASAYCLFPANAVATVAAAGWYYCTFSSTTTGTVFLDTYTSGTPTIPASPTAVSDGKGAYAAVIATTIGPQITMSGGAMGANGQLIATFDKQNTNSAGTKQATFLFGAVNHINGMVVTTTTINRGELIIANCGSQAVQKSTITQIQGGTIGTGTPVKATQDSSGALVCAFRSTRNTATDNDILDSYSIVVRYSA